MRRKWILNKPIKGVKLNPGHPLARGLISCWLFNDADGKLGKVHDISGNKNDGTLAGDTHMVPGKFGSALDFDGTGDYVDVGRPASLEVDFAQLTLSVWFKPALSTELAFIGKGTIWYFGMLSAIQLRFRHVNVGDGITDKFVPNMGTSWHHAAVVFDGVNTEIYLDSVSYGGEVAPGTLGVNVSKIGLGAATGTGIIPFEGPIDNIMVWNRALSSSEITLLHREPFCMFERQEIVFLAVAVGPANLLSVNAVTKANIKSINAVLIGSVKSINAIA